MKKGNNGTGAVEVNPITAFSLPGQRVSEETENSLKKAQEMLVKRLLARGYVREHPLAAASAHSTKGVNLSDLDLRREYRVGEELLCTSPLFHGSARIGKVISVYPQLLVVAYNSRVGKKATWNESFSKVDVVSGNIMEVIDDRAHDFI